MLNTQTPLALTFRTTSIFPLSQDQNIPNLFLSVSFLCKIKISEKAVMYCKLCQILPRRSTSCYYYVFRIFILTFLVTVSLGQKSVQRNNELITIPNINAAILLTLHLPIVIFLFSVHLHSDQYCILCI